MFSKIGVALLTVAVLFLGAPTDAFASSSNSNKKKIKKYFKKLKKLPDHGATAQQVSKLVKKLSKLDPKKAGKYYRIGLTKLNPTPSNKKAATKLQSDVVKIVNKAGLPDNQVKKVVKQTQKDQEKYNGETPTPTPYQALLLTTGSAVAA